FAVAVAASVDIMRAATNSSSDLDFQAWRLAVASDAWAVASGPNAFANLLDMIVLVTLSRRAVEEHWMTIYGTGAAPLLDCCRENETNIWHLADPYLKAGQRAELTAAIESWCKQHPGKECVSIVRALGWTSEIAKSSTQQDEHSTSVFNLLLLDPFAGLDP